MPIQTSQYITGAPVADHGHQQARALNTAPRPRFDLYFVPGSYSLIGGKVRPQLKTLTHQAGIDNVEQLPDGRISVVGARAIKVANKGAIFLGPEHCPAEMTPDGQPGYLRRYAGTKGPVYVEAWNRPVQRGARIIWSTDEAGHHAWLDHLMDSGAVPHPDEAVLNDLMDRAQHMRGAVEARRNQGAVIEEAAARADQHIAALQNAKNPTPKARRRKAATDG